MGPLAGSNLEPACSAAWLGLPDFRPATLPLEVGAPESVLACAWGRAPGLGAPARPLFKRPAFKWPWPPSALLLPPCWCSEPAGGRESEEEAGARPG